MPNKDNAPRSMHAYYSGRVQGVGFRFSAQRLGTSLGLKGWVKNLDDGRVEVVGEGETRALEEFIGKIDAIFGPYISDADIIWSDPAGGMEGFDIRF